MVKNAYLLPRITELFDKLKGAKYFTKLDVRWCYNNVQIKDGDQWKAAFKIKDSSNPLSCSSAYATPM